MIKEEHQVQKKIRKKTMRYTKNIPVDTNARQEEINEIKEAADIQLTMEP